MTAAAYNRTAFLDEVNSPLDTQEGVLSTDVQKSRILANLGVNTSEAPSAVITTAGAATYLSADILKGVVLRDPTGASRTDVLPTAALLVAALDTLGRAVVGHTFEFTVYNQADAAETVTLQAGAGGTLTSLASAAAIAQNGSKRYRIRITNVTSAAETYLVY